jgi:hypothetical protein
MDYDAPRQVTGRWDGTHQFGDLETGLLSPPTDPGKIGTIMNISNGTVSGEVEYTEREDGTWSFKLTLEDDPVPIESMDNFPTKELAQEQVNYELQAASLRIAEG